MSIVIVCDQPAELEALKTIAARQGFGKVHSFTHPAMALDWCARKTPDLIIIDFLLRANNGIELIRGLRGLPCLRHVPLLLMAPHGLQAVTAEALRQGATDFLATPIDPSEFATRVRNLLSLGGARECVNTPRAAWRDAPAEAALTSALH
jgi:PleD family two-component response regulator